MSECTRITSSGIQYISRGVRMRGLKVVFQLRLRRPLYNCVSSSTHIFLLFLYYRHFGLRRDAVSASFRCHFGAQLRFLCCSLLYPHFSLLPPPTSIQPTANTTTTYSSGDLMRAPRGFESATQNGVHN